MLTFVMRVSKVLKVEKNVSSSLMYVTVSKLMWPAVWIRTLMQWSEAVGSEREALEIPLRLRMLWRRWVALGDLEVNFSRSEAILVCKSWTLAERREGF